MPWFKRSYRGLYGNRMIQFGNQVSFAENKTRRTWKPNVQKKTLYSNTLREKFPTRLTTYVMRCIRKHGGFDEYLLNTRNSVIKYPRAIQLKERIIAARAEQQKQQGDAVGLDGGRDLTHVLDSAAAKSAHGASAASNAGKGSGDGGVISTAVPISEVRTEASNSNGDAARPLRTTRPSSYVHTCRGFADLL